MCFSATASFSSSALLAVTAIASFAKARNTPLKVLAGIPLIFSIQQCTEGIVWLSLLHTSWHWWQGTATCLFQVFAQAVWPMYIPFAVLLFEHEAAKRWAMSFLLLCGIALSVYTAYWLYRYPAQAIADHHHIRYVSGFALPQRWYYGLLYFLPTIVAPVLSSIKRLRWLGYLFFISYVAARALFHFYEISVWCFFGALISVTVFFAINEPLKAGQKARP